MAKKLTREDILNSLSDRALNEIIKTGSGLGYKYFAKKYGININRTTRIFKELGVKLNQKAINRNSGVKQSITRKKNQIVRGPNRETILLREKEEKKRKAQEAVKYCWACKSRVIDNKCNKCFRGFGK